MSLTSIFHELGIQYVVVMPDSRMVSAISKEACEKEGIEYIQALTEQDAASISAGLNLVGKLSVCAMENSGIRSACDLISRLELLNRIHNVFLLTNRGMIGEENWWGAYHGDVTNSVLNELRIKNKVIKDVQEFRVGLKKALETFRTEQVSVALLLDYDFFEDLNGDA